MSCPRIRTALNSVLRLANIPSHTYSKLEAHESESRLIGDLGPTSIFPLIGHGQLGST